MCGPRWRRCTASSSRRSIPTSSRLRMAEPRRLAIVGYGKMGRLIEQLAPEYGFAVGLKLDEFNNANFEGLTAENFRGIDAAIEFSIQIGRASCKEREGM